jgi:hypothetical protein
MAQNWTNDPALHGIDPAKMAMLQSFIGQGQGKNQNDMMSVLMAAASGSKKNGLQFTPSEIELIINVLKEGKSPGEVARMNKMISLFNAMQKK